MNSTGFLLIPFAVAGVILIPLFIMLWLGKRERRQVSTLSDSDLGSLAVYKTYWETTSKQSISGTTLAISGLGETKPTNAQRVTFAFVRSNANELFDLAIAAAKSKICAIEPNANITDLIITGLFLDPNPNEFEFGIDSEALHEIMPNGITVSFREKQIDLVEFVH